MKTAQVLTPWVVGAQPTPGNHPQLADAYPLLSWVDVTGQPAASIIPSPNLYTVQITCDDSVMDQIQQDSSYGVLWVH
jgi:hypothetical protein